MHLSYGRGRKAFTYRELLTPALDRTHPRSGIGKGFAGSEAELNDGNGDVLEWVGSLEPCFVLLHLESCSET